MFARAAAISRTGMTNLVRYSHSHGGIPGEVSLVVPLYNLALFFLPCGDYLVKTLY